MTGIDELAVTLRQATPADRDVIVGFNEALARESEDRALDRELLEPGVARVLEDATLGRYYLAEAGGEVIGQLMITLEWSDWRCGHFWWIQSVYVASTWRRQGVFTRLYGHVLEQARTAPEVCGLRLYVERENAQARATYRALGMEATGYRVMEVDFRETGTDTRVSPAR